MVLLVTTTTMAGSQAESCSGGGQPLLIGSEPQEASGTWCGHQTMFGSGWPDWKERCVVSVGGGGSSGTPWLSKPPKSSERENEPRQDCSECFHSSTLGRTNTTPIWGDSFSKQVLDICSQGCADQSADSVLGIPRAEGGQTRSCSSCSNGSVESPLTEIPDESPLSPE